jgi:pilus assembly protein Flp/PilA
MRQKISTYARQFLHDESGVSAIEYGLLAALVALAIVTGATALGTDLGQVFSAVATKLLSFKPA